MPSFLGAKYTTDNDLGLFQGVVLCGCGDGSPTSGHRLSPVDVSAGIRYVLTVDAKGVKGSGESKMAGPFCVRTTVIP